jgi:hypothetical protein
MHQNAPCGQASTVASNIATRALAYDGARDRLFMAAVCTIYHRLQKA